MGALHLIFNKWAKRVDTQHSAVQLPQFVVQLLLTYARLGRASSLSRFETGLV